MLANAVAVCESARSKGCKVIMAPITFADDASDNPNKGLGILAGCAGDKLFTAGTWNADFCEEMKVRFGVLVGSVRFSLWHAPLTTRRPSSPPLSPSSLRRATSSSLARRVSTPSREPTSSRS